MLKIVSLCLILFLAVNPCFAYTMLETDKFTLSMENYLRTDLVSFKNVVDLDRKNKDDSTAYLGIDYSLAFKSEYKNDGPVFYLKLERNGPYDYDTPLFIHNTLTASGGRIEAYRNDELLPQVEEFWVDAPLTNDYRFKAGLYTYEVGNGFSLNGGYENYGFTVLKESADTTWRWHYSRPDINYKNHLLGPRIRQEEEQGIIYEPGAANFFGADVKFNVGKNSLQPYIGVLADYTSPDKRDNKFAAPVSKDILGTAGIALCRVYGNLSSALELAHNFGQAESADASFKDISHAGFLIYTGLNYELDKVTPSLKFLAASGNKVTKDMAASGDTLLTGGKNRAFSYSSPLNARLSDSVSSSNYDILPIVAMGGGYGLNYGVPRPATFSFADFDNLIMPGLGFDFEVTRNLDLGFYWYYLSSFERGAGMLNGEPKYLSRDLGNEFDLFLDYKINPSILLSFLGGYFFPGEYYREKRDDTSGSLFAPFVRGDGKADKAYQIEVALELKF